jgi:peptide/nickel transport system permease protein
MRVLRRLITLPAVIWGVATITFFVARVIPADPAQIAAGLEVRPEQVQQLRIKMGLDKPLYVQYVRYLAGLLRGDLGVSLRTQNAVAADLAFHLPATIELTLVAMCLALVTGIPLGIFAAVYRGKTTDFLIRLTAISGVALPVFWLALIVQLFFYRDLGWFPAAGRIGSGVLPPTHITGLYLFDSLLTADRAAFASSLQHIVLPACVLAFGRWATLIRMTRVSMLDVLGQDYIRTAMAKGLRPFAVLFRHGLRNALIPVTTMAGLQVGYLLSGAVLVEWIFSWPGLGDYAVRSIVALDFNPIVAVAMVLSVIFVFVNSLVDALYKVLDPRIAV